MEVCILCNKQFIRLSSHVQSTHNVNYKDYLLKYILDSKVPLCACGCGNEAPFSSSGRIGFKTYIHNHHLFNHPVSQETRKKIGTRNSKNMKKYFKENPEIMLKHVEQMNNGKTQETEAKRIQSTKDTYKTIDKTKFIEHTKNLWKNKRDIMTEGGKKARKTWKERYESGQYDFTERDNKISETVTQLYLNAGFKWSRGEYTSSKMNRTYYYRSSWELKYMEHLDNDNNVKEWFYEPFVILYKLNDKQKRYLPDFEVYRDNKKYLIEIKPTSLATTKVNEAKCKAALEWCENNKYEYKQLAYNEKSKQFIE